MCIGNNLNRIQGATIKQEEKLNTINNHNITHNNNHIAHTERKQTRMKHNRDHVSHTNKTTNRLNQTIQIQYIQINTQ